MKKLFLVFAAFFLLLLAKQNAQPLFGAFATTQPVQGGTGISTIPTYGKVLVGNAGGTYTLTATSSLGTVTSITAGNQLDGGTVVTTGTIALKSSLSVFSASSTILGATSTIYVGTTASTTIVGNNGTSTFAGGISSTNAGGLASSNGLTLTGGNILSTSAATSTFAGGLNLSAGCFSINGSCVGGSGGGSGTVNSGTANNVAYYSTTGTTVDSTSTVTFTSASQVSVPIGTASLPGYTFINDTDTGITTNGANTLAFITAGSIRAQVLNTGGQQIRLNGNGTAGLPGFSFQSGTNGIFAPVNGAVSIATNGVETFTDTIAGLIGIGSTTPFASLSITGLSTTIPFAISSTTVTSASTTLFMIDKAGDVHFGGGTPTISTCGTAPFLDGNSTDQSGTVTFGATASACTITFSTPKLSSPHCLVSTRAVSLVNAYTVTQSTSALTITQAASGGVTFDYFCPLGH